MQQLLTMTNTTNPHPKMQNDTIASVTFVLELDFQKPVSEIDQAIRSVLVNEEISISKASVVAIATDENGGLTVETKSIDAVAPGEVCVKYSMTTQQFEIQLGINFLAFYFEKPYRGWETTIEIVQRYLSIIFLAIGSPSLVGAGLRYANFVTRNNPPDILFPPLMVAALLLEEAVRIEGYALDISLQYPEGDQRIGLETFKQVGDVVGHTLDLSFSGSLEGSQLQPAYDWFGVAHQRIYSTYRMVVHLPSEEE
jgi:uncharacterized protein (TIGR04255 family)